MIYWNVFYCHARLLSQFEQSVCKNSTSHEYCCDNSQKREQYNIHHNMAQQYFSSFSPGIRAAAVLGPDGDGPGPGHLQRGAGLLLLGPGQEGDDEGAAEGVRDRGQGRARDLHQPQVRAAG